MTTTEGPSIEDQPTKVSLLRRMWVWIWPYLAIGAVLAVIVGWYWLGVMNPTSDPYRDPACQIDPRCSNG